MDNIGWTTTGSNFVSETKEPGCGAHEKVEREFMIDIPTEDKF